MASEIRVNTINNSSGLGTITISDTGAVFTGITTIASLEVTGSLVGVANTAIINTQSVNVSGVVTATSFSGESVNVSGVVTATSFSGDGSALTGLSSDAISEGNTSAEVVDTGSDGHFKVITEGTEAFRIDASQDYLFKASNPVLKLYNSTNETATLINDNGGATSIRLASNSLIFADDGNNERARINSGRLLIGGTTSQTWSGGAPLLQVSGTSASGTMHLGAFQYSNSSDGGELVLGSSRGTTVGSTTIVQNGDTLGRIRFCAADGNDLTNRGGEITCQIDGTPGSDDIPTRMMFYTASDGAGSPTERMRIDSEGVVRAGNNLTAARRDSNGIGMKISTNWPDTPLEIENEASGTRYAITFWQGSTQQGRIETSSGSTNYVTSSDYRLKENIVPVTDGIERLLQLNPSRFNFIAHPSKTVDGFLAHEVQDVVPEAISGEKDAVAVWQEGEELPDGVSIGDNKLDEDGNTIPIYQGIDQSKLVPLLTAALQEAIGKIETLETEKADILARLDAAGI